MSTEDATERAIESIRRHVAARARALGLQCTSVRVFPHADQLHALAQFDIQDDAGYPWEFECRAYIAPRIVRGAG